MVISGGKRSNSSMGESLTGRVLVLGKKQVGKSATIVRYTTGRFIGSYGSSTSDWLYRHWLGWDEKKRLSTTIELLEQKDISFESGANLFNDNPNCQTKSQSSTTSGSSNNKNQSTGCSQISSLSNSSASQENKNGNNSCEDDGINQSAYEERDHVEQSKWSLSWRVAMDLERDEKVDLLNRIQWAHAYVVVYAIDDFESYEKAIRYLNLIAQTNYGSIYAHHHQQNHGSSHATYNSGSGRNHSITSQHSSSSSLSTGSQTRPDSSGSNRVNGSDGPTNAHQITLATGLSLSNLNSSPSPTASSISTPIPTPSTTPTPTSLSVSGSNPSARKPILLLANKSDLAHSGARKVSTSEGRNLALRHQAMFAELSVSKSQIEIEAALNYLFESIDLQSLISSPQPKHLIEASYNNANNNLVDCTNCDSDKTNGKSNEKIRRTSNQIHRNSFQLSQNDSTFDDEDELDAYPEEMHDVFLIQDRNCFENCGLHHPNINVSSDDHHCNNVLAGSICNINHAGASASALPPTNAANLSVKPPSGPQTTRSPSNGSRYKNLKSSFKRASMAIVSSRTLLNPNSHNQNQLNHNNNSSILSKSSNSINLSLSQQQTISQPRQANYIVQKAASETNHTHQQKTHTPSLATQPGASINAKNQTQTKKHHQATDKKITSGNNKCQSDSSLDNVKTVTTNNNNKPYKVANKGSKESLRESGAYYTGLVSERLKRTIFKYKTRRKTLAFESPPACKSQPEDDDGVLLEGDVDQLFNRLPADWSVDSTNSLNSLGTTTTALNKGKNYDKECKANLFNETTSSVKQTTKKAINLDRSRSALNKGDKLYYRSIFGLQRPLNGSNKQNQPQNDRPQAAPIDNQDRPGSSSSSFTTSGKSSSASLSMSPIPLQQQVHDLSQEHHSDGRHSTSNVDVTSQTASGQGPNSTGKLVLGAELVAKSEPVIVPMKKHSTVRNVMNSLTRRSTPQTGKMEKQNSQQPLTSAKKPLYAGLFGGGGGGSRQVGTAVARVDVIISPPVVFKQTIEPVSLKVSRVETIKRSEPLNLKAVKFGSKPQVNAEFCQ